MNHFLSSGGNADNGLRVGHFSSRNVPLDAACSLDGTPPQQPGRYTPCGGQQRARITILLPNNFIHDHSV